MKRFIVILIIISAVFFLTACSTQLKTTGCRVIHQEDKYVTYQTVCDNCGYEYGGPATAYVFTKLFYTVTCSECGELIYVRLQRG